MYANLLKTDKSDKSEITRTTTTIKSFFRPLTQYMLAVKNIKVLLDFSVSRIQIQVWMYRADVARFWNLLHRIENFP